MDIVFLTDHLIRGGADAQLARIASTLKARGWSVGVLTMLPSLEFKEELKARDIPLYACAPGIPRVKALPLGMAFRMIRQLRRWKPAVLVTFNYHGDIMGRVLGRVAGVPGIVSSLRTAYVKTSSRKLIYKHTERFIDFTASNSHAAITYMVDRGLLTPTKTLVIPNGIPCEAFPAPFERELVRAEFGLEPGTFTWLAVGNLRPAKDYPTLLRAVERFRDSGRDFQVLVAGGGEDGDALLAEAERRGLQDRVHFLGSRTDVPRLLRAADAFVLSSAWEGMPNTVMEAMASGVPVVSTDAGGVRELVQQGTCGFIVPCGDDAALAGRMEHVMDLPAGELIALGEAGRERIRTTFDNEVVLNRWEALLRQVIRATGKPVPAGREPVTQVEAAHALAGPPPAFVISLDFELLWGMRDKRTIETYGENLLGERQAVPAMLALFRKYGVKATWATVGMSAFGTKKELLANLPALRPSYARQGLDPYADLPEIGEDEQADPYHFGASLLRQIRDCEGMEIGSHTFSHYYCLETGQDDAQFKADLEASVEAFRPYAVRPVSFVFPRNQYNARYLSICAEAGFTVFRGNEDSWVYRESRNEDLSSFRRLTRLADHYVDLTGAHGFIPRTFLDSGMINCPASRFLRPFSSRLARLDGLRVRRIQQAMTRAASRGESYHLWWHPHNFGTHLRENLAVLESLLQHHQVLRDRYGVVSMTMEEVGAATRKAEAGNGVRLG